MDKQDIKKKLKLTKIEKAAIQEVYESYQSCQDPQEKNILLMQLLQLVEIRGKKIVSRSIKTSLLRKDDAVEEVLGMVRELFAKNILINYEKKRNEDADFRLADYMSGVYQRCFYKYCHQSSDDTSGNKISLEAIQDGESRVTLPAQEEDFTEKFELSDEEMILEKYVDTTMHYADYGMDPFQVMLFCYSKLLAIVATESKCKSSDKWAWEVIDVHTMNQLTSMFVKLFNSAMQKIKVQWGDSHMKMLKKKYERSPINDTTIPKDKFKCIGDVIMSQEFTPKYTKNWVDRVDARIKIQTVKNILASADEEMLDLARRYHLFKNFMPSRGM